VDRPDSWDHEAAPAENIGAADIELRRTICARSTAPPRKSRSNVIAPLALEQLTVR